LKEIQKEERKEDNKEEPPKLLGLTIPQPNTIRPPIDVKKPSLVASLGIKSLNNSLKTLEKP
jgi:hypothetical protein